jgi:hypothetical protein
MPTVMTLWKAVSEPWPDNRGSEGGIVRLDEKHEPGLRITLEEGGVTAPWSITCGMAGLFVHTAFAATEAEARAMLERMKVRLVEIAKSGDPIPIPKPFVDEF